MYSIDLTGKHALVMGVANHRSLAKQGPGIWFFNPRSIVFIDSKKFFPTAFTAVNLFDRFQCGSIRRFSS